MQSCRSCNADIQPFIDFGRMPLANGFLPAGEFADEFFYHLRAAYCPRCTLVQLVEQPPAERMFNDRYPFHSSSSARMSAHFARLAADIIERFLPNSDPFLVEIGSNDGTLLAPAAARGIRHLGIEPSASVAAAAVQRGVRTLCRFFDPPAAKAIVAAEGAAQVVVAANALSHVADPHAVIAAIDLLLAPRGVVIIEDPYWADVLATTAFDQIYDEHASYFTLTSLERLFAEHGMTVFDVLPVDVHGGSMRYFISRGQPTASARVSTLRAEERRLSTDYGARLTAFAGRVTAICGALRERIERHRLAGRRVVGYGATSKSTTTINFAGITSELLEFISDTTPAKQGTFSPGAHIPIRPQEAFALDYPERAVLFPWNHLAEIRAKETTFSARGGKWIVYVPELQEL